MSTLQTAGHSESWEKSQKAILKTFEKFVKYEKIRGRRCYR